MRSFSLQNVDLNLLLPLKALLEERSVTRAAKTVNLSQPAMSRALERLRDALGDELLIRSQGGYILTTRGARLLREIDQVVPRLEHLWSGEQFSPLLTTAKVRVVMNALVASLMLPSILRALPQHAPGLRLEVLPWTEDACDQLKTGAVDLVFSSMAAPPPLVVQRLYQEEFVCVVAKRHPFKGKVLRLEDYLKLKHVEVHAGQQSLVDLALAEKGHRREIGLQLPYFVVAVEAVEASDYVLTCPSRLSKRSLLGHALRQIKSPPEFPLFNCWMIWHPRCAAEILHSWFREFVVNLCSGKLDPSSR